MPKTQKWKNVQIDGKIAKFRSISPKAANFADK